MYKNYLTDGGNGMKRILIIEDDIAIAELERDYLEANEFQTKICQDGLQGLNSALKEDFDLILLDIMLPNFDGFEICRTIRKEKNTPIMFVSAKREDIDKIRGLGIGANDYIVKPFQPSELIARIKAHIANYERLTKQIKKNNEILLDGLRIDLDAHEVYVDDEFIIMPNKEFELLAFLALHPNIVFKKDQLFERIWGLDAIGEISTVTVHINRIRDKIDKNKVGIKYIDTVWGSGYRFHK